MSLQICAALRWLGAKTTPTLSPSFCGSSEAMLAEAGAVDGRGETDGISAWHMQGAKRKQGPAHVHMKAHKGWLICGR